MVGLVVAAGNSASDEQTGEGGLFDFNVYAGDRCHLNRIHDGYGHGRDGALPNTFSSPTIGFTPERMSPRRCGLADSGTCSCQTALHMLNVAYVPAGRRV